MAEMYGFTPETVSGLTLVQVGSYADAAADAANGSSPQKSMSRADVIKLLKDK